MYFSIVNMKGKKKQFSKIVKEKEQKKKKKQIKNREWSKEVNTNSRKRKKPQHFSQPVKTSWKPEKTYKSSENKLLISSVYQLHLSSGKVVLKIPVWRWKVTENWQQEITIKKKKFQTKENLQLIETNALYPPPTPHQLKENTS